jgi:hypothetical protein
MPPMPLPTPMAMREGERFGGVLVPRLGEGGEKR